MGEIAWLIIMLYGGKNVIVGCLTCSIYVWLACRLSNICVIIFVLY